MEEKTKKIKEEVLKKLGKIKMKEDEINDLINEIKSKVDEINGVKEKPIKTNYGTSCLRLENQKGQLIDEY
jgi:ABC-type Fe3+-hydroxamate transport system substrate-binding protein